MLGCRLCTGMDAPWKDKTAVAHQGVGCPAGERGQMESWACGGLCNLALAADSERKAFAPPSATVIAADAPPWARNFRQVFPSWRQSLCAAFLEAAWILPRHKKSASCWLPWEGQVEYDPKILPPPRFTIKVKIWSGEAAAKLLISTLMTTSAFLKFHFDLHGPAQSAVKLQFSWVKCLLVF